MKAPLILCLSLLLSASGLLEAKPVKLKSKVKLVMPGESGNNGAGVAWNPKLKIYYACFAGNDSYPLVMFNSKGKVINSSLTVRLDTRGFWFNEEENRLEGTVYGGAKDYPGYYYREVDAKGVPGVDQYMKFPQMEMPSEQSAGTYVPSKDVIIFRDRDIVFGYSKKDGSLKTELRLTLPSGASWDGINEHTIIYTGKKGEEYGVFDFDNSSIYLFDAVNGNHTKTLQLPAEAPDPRMFNFSYANGMFWLFSQVSRTCYGYPHK